MPTSSRPISRRISNLALECLVASSELACLECSQIPWVCNRTQWVWVWECNQIQWVWDNIIRWVWDNRTLWEWDLEVECKTKDLEEWLLNLLRQCPISVINKDLTTLLVLVLLQEATKKELSMFSGLNGSKNSKKRTKPRTRNSRIYST